VVTHVPALDYLSTYGDTREAALESTREAIIGYLEAAAKDGIRYLAADSSRASLSLRSQCPDAASPRLAAGTW
jgi:predicted RNase H-like HicB family nuclease